MKVWYLICKATVLFGFLSSVALAEQAPKANSEATTSVANEEVAPVPKTPKFKVSYDKVFYEFQGERAANQMAYGESVYGFDRVTYDTNLLTLSYLYSPTLSFSVLSGYNTIYAETKVYGFLSVDQTEGLSDTTIKATKTFLQTSGIYVGEFGFTLPTGSIQEKNTASTTIDGDNYPYNMQLGTGTNDLVASGTYIKPINQHMLGAFGMATVRLGRNSQGYRKGDEFMAKTWYSYNVNPYVAPGVWLNYSNIQGVVGRDRTLTYAGADEVLRFYYTPKSFWDVTANVSANYPVNPQFKVKGMLAAPLAQHSKNVDDIQLYTQWFAQLGVEGQF